MVALESARVHADAQMADGAVVSIGFRQAHVPQQIIGKIGMLGTYCTRITREKGIECAKPAGVEAENVSHRPALNQQPGGRDHAGIRRQSFRAVR